MSGSYGFPPRAFPAGECGPPAPWWLVAIMVIGIVVYVLPATLWESARK